MRLSVLRALCLGAGILGISAAQSFHTGDKVVLESLGTIKGNRWLDGRTANSSVGLAPDFGRPFSGAVWQLENVGGDLFRIQTMGDAPGARWLSCRSANPAVMLSPTTAGAAGFQTQWHLVSTGSGSIGLRCSDAGALWLDGRTANGTVGLAPSTAAPFTGARWLAHAILPSDVLTQRYNSFRTGVDTAETVLTPALMRSGRFGKLFARAVDGQVYGQPLYVANISLPGKGLHNVVFVATTSNFVYAFDADDPAQGAPLWRSERLGTPVPRSDIVPDTLIDPVFGITSTPVIDAATKTLYVVAKSKTVATLNAPADLADGDTITLECLGDAPGNRWLNALTVSGGVSLAPAFGGDANSGTWWEVARHAGTDALSLRSLGFIQTPTVWLDGRTQDGSVGLARSTAPPFTGASWRLQLVAGGEFSLKTLGTIPGPKTFLDGRTADGTVGLAANTAPPFTGTRWRITKHVYHNFLFALDLTTGSLKRSVEIQGTAAGTRFLSRMHLNRPGLLLDGGRVYVAFGAHADRVPFNGWIFAYNAADLQPRGTFVATPGGWGAGIWQSGAGLAADESGHIYVMTGNGGPAPGTTDFTNSFIRLHADEASRSLQVDGMFHSQTGQNIDLNLCDLDLGSAGPVHLPGSTLVIGAGKEGTLYSLDINHMQAFAQAFNVSKNQWNPATPSCTQWNDVETWPHVHYSPVVWPVGQGSLRAYLWPEQDRLKGFLFSEGRFVTTPFASSADRAPAKSMPGGMLAVSAFGGALDTGIVWATRPSDCPASDNSPEDQRPCNAQFKIVPGTLKAFDARTLQELWSSSAPGDQLGAFAKFNPPTVAHGRVYVGTFDGKLAVYGVRPGM